MDHYSLLFVPRIVEYMSRLGLRRTVWSGRLSASADLSISVGNPMFICMLPVVEEETTLSYVAVACDLLIWLF